MRACSPPSPRLAHRFAGQAASSGSQKTFFLTDITAGFERPVIAGFCPHVLPCAWRGYPLLEGGTMRSACAPWARPGSVGWRAGMPWTDLLDSMLSPAIFMLTQCNLRHLSKGCQKQRSVGAVRRGPSESENPARVLLATQGPWRPARQCGHALTGQGRTTSLIQGGPPGLQPIRPVRNKSTGAEAHAAPWTPPPGGWRQCARASCRSNRRRC